MPKTPRRTLSVILFAVFLDLVSNGILVPVVPQLLANPDSPYYLLPHYVPIGYSYVLLGFLIAAFPIVQFFSTPIVGEYSDYYGRRKVLSIALFVTAISFGTFAVGVMMKNLYLLFASRIIGGIAGGNISVAQAAIADITPPRQRAARFGLVGAAYGLGFIIGPVLGGVLSDSSMVSWFNAATPFWLATGLSLISSALIWVFMAETRQATSGLSISWLKAIGNIIHAYGMKSVRWVFVTNFLFQASITLFATFFTVFLIDSFGMTQTSIGYYIGYAGLWMVMTQGVAVRILSKRFDEVFLLRIFLLTGSLGIFAYYIPEHLIGLLVVGACFAFTNGISMAVLPSLVSRRTSPAIQGEILGINASIQALAQAGPPIVAGFLAAHITPAAPIYVAGGVMGLAWLVFIIFVKKEVH